MTTTLAGGGTSLVTFTEPIEAPRGTRLAAVVVWRGPTAEAERGLLPVLRGLWPFGRRPRPSHWELPDGWNAAADGGTPSEVLYSTARAAVQVRGRDYALPPDGRTLVLLVHESPGAAPETPGEVRVEEHALDTPPQPKPVVDPTLPNAVNARRIVEGSDEANRVWFACLARDPAVVAFLKGTSVGAHLAEYVSDA
jgi:hypothetical protein